MKKPILIALFSLLLSGCISTPTTHYTAPTVTDAAPEVVAIPEPTPIPAPKAQNTANICKVLDRQQHWHQSIMSSVIKYQVPAYLMLAIMAQESAFYAHAKPPRKVVSGIKLWTRVSSAYGFAQAIDSTWRRYQEDIGNNNAKRYNFADAIDFVGWYVTQSSWDSNIAKTDTYNQYLAYHEGQTGFNRQSYLAKPWLLKVAKAVRKKAWRYQQQLKQCRFEYKNYWSLSF